MDHRLLRMMTLSVLTLLAFGFQPTTHQPVRHSSTPLATVLQRSPGESKDEYFRRVTQVASDPQQFERFVLDKKENTTTTTTSTGSQHQQQQQALSMTGGNASTSTARGYVRAEEWEAEQQKKQKAMSMEERMQHEAQHHGDRFRQNEILRHHLNGF